MLFVMKKKAKKQRCKATAMLYSSYFGKHQCQQKAGHSGPHVVNIAGTYQTWIKRGEETKPMSPEEFRAEVRVKRE
jgi:hypothetical protein